MYDYNSMFNTKYKWDSLIIQKKKRKKNEIISKNQFIELVPCKSILSKENTGNGITNKHQFSKKI